MFTLDAEFRSERSNFNDQKNKIWNQEKPRDSIANGKKNENTDIEEMANNCMESKEDAAKIIYKFEEIIKNKKSEIVWLSYYQVKKFQKFRSKERFVIDMVSKFKVSKSTIVFKIALSKLIDEYPNIKNSSLSLPYFKKQLKLIKQVWKESASECK